MTEELEAGHVTKKQKHEERIVQRVWSLMRDQLAEGGKSSSDIGPEELSQLMKFVTFVRFVAASALLAGAIGGVYEYLTLVGVVDMSPARVVLIGAWLFFGLFVADILLFIAPQWKRKRKIQCGIMMLVLSACSLLILDHWAIGWKQRHELEAAKPLVNIQQSVNDLPNRIAEEIRSKPGEQKVTTGPPEIKKIISTVAGFLKMELETLTKPIFAAGQPIFMNVHFANRGNSYVHNASEFSDIVIVQVSNFKTVNVEVKEYFEKKRANFARIQADVAPGEGIWTTLDTKPLTPDELDRLVTGKYTMFQLSHAEWTTNGKPDYLDRCLWLQAPLRADISEHELVWQRC